MMQRPFLLATTAALLLPLPVAADPPARLVDVRMIWDKAPHNAFTDLVHHRDRWFCVFREGENHVSADGALRILSSTDGTAWTSVARLARPGTDLRDAKLATTPDGRLMLNGAACLDVPERRHHQSLAWFSDDGLAWSEPTPIGRPDDWLWRVDWRAGRAYSIGYATGGSRNVRLYESLDGRTFHTLVDSLGVAGYPNESAIAFLPPKERAICLLRRDGNPAPGLLGSSSPPYTNWSWKELDARIGGPDLLRLADGRLLAGVRLHDDRVRTSLCLVDPETPRLVEILALPSGGDCGYPGLTEHDGLIWVSYYSSHEGKTSVYLARVALAAP